MMKGEEEIEGDKVRVGDDRAWQNEGKSRTRRLNEEGSWKESEKCGEENGEVKGRLRENREAGVADLVCSDRWGEDQWWRKTGAGN